MGFRQGAVEVMALKTDETPAPSPIALVALARSALSSPVLRFLVVGGGNTLLYAVLCGGLGLPREVGVLASCAAFAIIGYILMKL